MLSHFGRMAWQRRSALREKAAIKHGRMATAQKAAVCLHQKSAGEKAACLR
jgi:hypothetical protein